MKRERWATPLGRMTTAQLADVVASRTVPGEGGCIVYARRLNRDGYGEISSHGRHIGMAHRIAYEAKRGPIPEGLTLDHLCRNRACVNPAHLEPTTSIENTMRGDFPSAVNARKTHCVNGHEFTPENTYVWRGTRQCRACNRAHRARKKGASDVA